jgi:putative endonuclease
MSSSVAKWVVYLLRCADGTLYCGVTNDLEKRVRAHSRGGVKYTRGRLPVEVALTEPARDRSDAQRKEAALKRLPRAQKLARIARGVVSARHDSKRNRSPSVPARRRVRRERD